MFFILINLLLTKGILLPFFIMNSILSNDSIPNDIGDIFFNIQGLFDKFKASLIMLLSLYEINSVLSLNKLESELIKNFVFSICPSMSIFVITFYILFFVYLFNNYLKMKVNLLILIFLFLIRF